MRVTRSWRTTSFEVSRTKRMPSIVLNVSTVAWINQPEQWTDAKSNWIAENLSPHGAYRLRYAAWRWQQYAHYAGLDNRWQMFGRQSRFNWWYDIRAIYSDGGKKSSVLLPIPNQSARTLVERLLFDLKERKFELNIYLNPVARESYSRYLARQFPTHNGLPIQSIRWHLCTQRILPPSEAVAKHQLVDTHAQVHHLNDFRIAHPPEREQTFAVQDAKSPPQRLVMQQTETTQ